MFKIVFLTKRKAGVSESQYFRHYADIHFPLAVALPGLLAYYQQPLVHGGWNGTDSFPTYDALSEYTFETKGAAEQAFASPQGAALNEDTGHFIDWDTVLSIPVTVQQSYSARRHYLAGESIGQTTSSLTRDAEEQSAKLSAYQPPPALTVAQPAGSMLPNGDQTCGPHGP